MKNLTFLLLIAVFTVSCGKDEEPSFPHIPYTEIQGTYQFEDSEFGTQTFKLRYTGYGKKYIKSEKNIDYYFDFLGNTVRLSCNMATSTYMILEYVNDYGINIQIEIYKTKEGMLIYLDFIHVPKHYFSNPSWEEYDGFFTNQIIKID